MAENVAQLVKAQADIVRVIGEYVRLRKTGAQNFTGLCPFHKEKTGSFSVNATHGYFHCFGCHETGDVFKFVMKLESVSFPEALRVVAAKCGIALPKREFASPEEAREAAIRRGLLDIHEAATQYFEQALRSPVAARAREYLTGRGVGAETIARFRMGWAPDDFNHMREQLKGHFSEDVMRASGLFSAKEQADGSPGPMYAKFRGRVTFPILNEGGKVIAFTARALETKSADGRDVAKYMNSPETPLYSKGTVLFNLDKAKGEMRTHDFALLVEGQMDAISVYMAGVKNVIATSGTAFTEAQVRLLGRFTKRVVVNFDPDTAGAAAAERTLTMLVEEGFEVKVVTLEGGMDPDRFVRERGVDGYMAALRGARRHADYLIEQARQQVPGRTSEAKVKAMNFLLPHIRRMPQALARDEFVMDAAQKLGIESGILREEVRRAAAARVESVPVAKRAGEEQVSETERVLLRALARPEGDTAREFAATEVGAHPEWVEGLVTGAVMEALAAGLPGGGSPLDAAPDAASRALLARVLEEEVGEGQDLEGRVRDALHTLERRAMERRGRDLRLMLAEADRRGDMEAVGRLAREKIEMDRRVRGMGRVN